MTRFGCQPLLKLKFISAICLCLTLTACGGGGGGTTGDSFGPTTTNTKPQSSTETTSSQSTSSDSSSPGELPSSIASSNNTTSKSSSSAKSTSSKRSSSTSGTIDTTAPTAPEQLLASSIYNRVALSWSPASDNVGVVYYRIYRDQVLIDTLWAPEDSYVDYDVAPNRSYTYGISAGDGVNNWSTVKSIPVTTPSAPTQSMSSTSSAIASTTSSKTSSSVSNSQANSNSSQSSSKSSSQSSSKSSSSSSSKTADTTAPSMPTIKQDGAFASHVDISWTASTDNQGVTGYRVYRDATLIATLAGNELSYSDTSVQANRQYLYGVSAGDAAGNWSAQKTLLINTPSSTVSGDITLIWLTPSKRENGNALSLGELSGYELRYKRQTDEEYTYVSLSKLTLLYVLPALTGDYQFELAAIDTNYLYSEFKSLTPQ